MKDHAGKCTVIVNLGREEVDYLDLIGKDALFSKGTKLSRNKVISAMILAIKELGLNGKGTKTKEDLQKKIAKAIDQKHQAVIPEPDSLLNKKFPQRKTLTEQAA
jgi:hypothetical protein